MPRVHSVFAATNTARAAHGGTSGTGGQPSEATDAAEQGNQQRIIEQRRPARDETNAFAGAARGVVHRARHRRSRMSMPWDSAVNTMASVPTRYHRCRALPPDSEHAAVVPGGAMNHRQAAHNHPSTAEHARKLPARLPAGIASGQARFAPA